ncbi:MAG TPA: hypothetical protein VF411_07755 [Bacteroidia bacterium]
MKRIVFCENQAAVNISLDQQPLSVSSPVGKQGKQLQNYNS